MPHASQGQDVLRPKEFRQLQELIYSECGIHLLPEKQTMLEVRLRKRLQSLSLGSLAAYHSYVFQPGSLERELPNLIDVVTTNKTDFFRESRHFQFLTNSAVPALIQHCGGYLSREMIVWSAGCSTGEEPYTLAMVLSEYAERNPGFRFRILGTDISTVVLELARKAVFKPEAIEGVPRELRQKYFLRGKNRETQRYRIVPELRELVEFRRINFMQNDFGIAERVDAVFCRNVIIYFDQATRKLVLQRIVRQLAPRGYLFMGHSETLNGLDLDMTLIEPTVYRRPDAAGRR